MIPKIIHYCWFGNHPLPKIDQKYINGWHKRCPDFKIIRWSESNFNWQAYEFTRRAYHLRNWAAVSDYVRLMALKKFGGVYLDTDVRMIKSIAPFLKQRAFIGMENPKAIASGLIFGAQPHNPNVESILQVYNLIAHKLNFKDLLNDQVYITTAHFYKQGFVFSNLKQKVDGCTIYPTSYFCPKHLGKGLKTNFSPSTYTVHEYAGSWSNDPIGHRQTTFNHQFKTKLKYYLNMMN